MIDSNFDPSTIPLGYTYDHNGRVLRYCDETGFWYAYTYDDAGRVVTCINSDEFGFWYSYTRDDAGRVLTWRTSSGYREHYTYDAAGKCTITRTRTQEAPDAA